MRDDSIGLFWQDEPKVKGGKSAQVRAMPPIPDTGWKPPREYPNLSTARAISVDVETFDPELTERGPGWARHKGHIVGVSLGTDDGYKWYFPMRHEVEPEYNLDPDITLRYLADTLGNRFQPKVGANVIYDYGWLKEEGVHVQGQLIDVQYAEALLSDYEQVALEVLARKYLGEGKESNLLYQWCADYYGGKPNGKQRANIYRASPRMVGPYAEADADLPMRLAPILYQKLDAEGLRPLFELECALIPLTAAMRFRGVRVDLDRARSLQVELVKREEQEQVKLDNLVGFHVETTKSASIAKAFDALGLKYNLTEAGAPSFTKAFLENTKNPVADCINEIRRYNKIHSTFIQSYILDANIDGRIYCQFNPVRGDTGGTVSGRWSSSTPNLQNIPARDEELAPLMRGLFVPDEGYRQWRKFDYSQIEYRFLVHYATGKGSDEARQKYIANPHNDYHDMTMDMVVPYAGWDVSTPEKRKHKRRPLKNINFGLVYGMGEPKLARDLKMSLKEGKDLFKAYHSALPFVRATMEQAENEVAQLGYITTILGRRSRFDMWVPRQYGVEGKPLPYEAAVREYGYNIHRADSHKAINRRLQGSSADQIKTAMLKGWQSGVFDYIGVPHLTVHDELDFSDEGNKDDGFEYFQQIMQDAIPLRIPVVAEMETGPDWGHVK